MLNFKVIYIFVFVFLQGNCKPTKTEHEITKQLAKRQIFQTFSSNPRFHDVFNGDPDRTLTEKFLGSHVNPINVHTHGNYIFQLPLLEDDEDYEEYNNYKDYGEEDDDNKYKNPVSNESDDKFEAIVVEVTDPASENISNNIENNNQQFTESSNVALNRNTSKNEEIVIPDLTLKNMRPRKEKNDKDRQKPDETLYTNNTTNQIDTKYSNTTTIKDESEFKNENFSSTTPNNISNKFTYNQTLSNTTYNALTSTSEINENFKQQKQTNNNNETTGQQDNLQFNPNIIDQNDFRNIKTSIRIVTEKTEPIPLGKLYTSPINITTNFTNSVLPNITHIPLQLSNKKTNTTKGAKKQNVTSKINEDVKDIMLYVSKALSSSEQHKNGTKTAKEDLEFATRSKVSPSHNNITENVTPTPQKHSANFHRQYPSLVELLGSNNPSVYNKKPIQKDVSTPNINTRSNNNQTRIVKNNVKQQPAVPNWSNILLEKIVSDFVQKSLLGEDYQNKRNRNVTGVKSKSVSSTPRNGRRDWKGSKDSRISRMKKNDEDLLNLLSLLENAQF